MRRDGEDFVAHAAAAVGDRYAYVLGNSLPIPDPVSRFLPGCAWAHRRSSILQCSIGATMDVRGGACASCRRCRNSARSCVPPTRRAAAVSSCRSRRAPAAGSGTPPCCSSALPCQLRRPFACFSGCSCRIEPEWWAINNKDSAGQGFWDSTKSLVVFGRIRYLDLINRMDRPEVHETCWCFAYVLKEKRFVEDGPEEHNRCTQRQKPSRYLPPLLAISRQRRFQTVPKAHETLINAGDLL